MVVEEHRHFLAEREFIVTSGDNVLLSELADSIDSQTRPPCRVLKVRPFLHSYEFMLMRL
jgi:hypothetical protein